tara:strand:- start:16206 stop:17480 length:1275 start_codon:yes stop_codon:yes gene_type:complete
MPSRFRYSIRARLQWSVMALIVAITALCGICMVLLVFWFERTLFYNHLVGDLERYIDEYQSAQNAVRIPRGDITFYKLPSTDHTLLPEAFRYYPEGNFEVLSGPGAYSLIVRNRSPWVYVLAQDQSDFERLELLAVAGIVFGFLLISGLGYWLSRYIASQVLLPVMTLAAAVNADPGSGRSPGFNPDHYSRDEVGGLAQAVQGYADQVADLLERERQFTADVSHELRTPMMVIQAASDVLAESTNDNPAQQRVLSRIERAIKDMQQQIALYLELAREPGESQRDDDCTLPEAANAALELWKSRADEQGIALRCSCEPGSSEMRVSRVLISAVLNNLLHNALNHTRAGSVSIEVTGRNVAVRDTGSGIDPGVAAHIFERGVRSPQGPGSRYGLGLSISKRICDHQRWQLDVQPNSPQGTTFTLTV